MSTNFKKHPCFNAKSRHKYARVHLPVAPRCNIQCNYCSRDYDCVNESRPGVCSTILTPQQALKYVEKIYKKVPNLAVVGIAGPGDPFANPQETLETFRLVKEKFPKLILCVSTNGLNVEPYIDELAELEVGHVTVTLNAVDTEIMDKIYEYVRFNKRLIKGEKASLVLLDKQLSAIKKLKEAGITVKVNTVIVPGINDDHAEKVAQTISKLGADIHNCIPFMPSEGTTFADLPSPTKEKLLEIRQKTGNYLPQMFHCARCRADACGIVGEENTQEIMNELKNVTVEEKEEVVIKDTEKKIAIASFEGILVNQHLGEAQEMMIFKPGHDGYTLLEKRAMPYKGAGNQRWEDMADILKDCSTIIVNGAGESPKRILSKHNIEVKVLEGVIEDVLGKISKGESLCHLLKHETVCQSACSGNGMGCGA